MFKQRAYQDRITHDENESVAILERVLRSRHFAERIVRVSQIESHCEEASCCAIHFGNLEPHLELATELSVKNQEYSDQASALSHVKRRSCS